MKTIGFTKEQYDQIIEIGKRCGFNMVGRKKGQRAKFVVVAVKIAEIAITSSKIEAVKVENRSDG